MIYRGIPYIAFGSKSEWTNGDTKIEKVWRPFPYSDKYDWLATIHFRWTIVLKVKLSDRDNPFTQKALDTANKYADFKKTYYSKRDGSRQATKQDDSMELKGYYSKQNGSYIGDAARVYRLVTKFGITEFFSCSGEAKRTASIGWSPKNQKWYGWSHRALAGFGIGSERVEGHIAFDEYGYMKAKTLKDAKLMAEQFARDIG